ncbi:MAG: GFA family protein [Colwellia sp.]|nr:GFA family protein [Colwellia sp.]
MSIQDNTEALNKGVLTGGCLCGAVRYKVTNQFSHFFLCNCQQCQQFTGSAFAANIFTAPENIQWLTGYEKISHYEHPGREFSKAFCSICGCAQPFINKSGKSLIIPAGSLTEKFESIPDANIFVNEQAHWLSEGLTAKKFRHFPE